MEPNLWVHWRLRQPDQPVGSVDENIRQLEARLTQEPNDPAGWRLLGLVLFRDG